MTRPYDPDRHCGAHPDAENGPCRLVHGWGTKHLGSGRCRKHGGNTPNGERFARTEEARAAVRTYGLPIDIDPAEALLQEVHRTAGAVAWLAEQVQAIEPGALVWGRTKHRAGRGPEGPIDVTDEGAELNVWLALYQQERTHLVKVCTAALAAGVEERRVRLAESQGTLLAAAVRAILADLDLSEIQQARVAEVVPRHLRAVSG